MAKFVREVSFEFRNSFCKIPWGHVTHLLDKTKSQKEFEWHVFKAIKTHLS